MKTKMLLLMLMLGCVAASVQAESFVAAGAKGTLEVEYLYDAAGKTQDQYDTHEWRVKRAVNLTAQLSAQAPAPLPDCISSMPDSRRSLRTSARLPRIPRRRLSRRRRR